MNLELRVPKSTYVIARERSDGTMEIYTQGNQIQTYRARKDALKTVEIIRLAVLPADARENTYPEDAEFWAPYRLRLFKNDRKWVHLGF